MSEHGPSPYEEYDPRLGDEEAHLLRSEPMKYMQVVVPRDVAAEALEAVGELRVAHMVDLNADTNAFQREFVDRVKLCDDLLRQLEVLERHMDNLNLHPVAFLVDPSRTNESIDALPQQLDAAIETSTTLNANYQNLLKQSRELVEYRIVVDVAYCFANSEQGRDALDVSSVEMLDVLSPQASLFREDAIEKRTGQPLLRMDDASTSQSLSNRVLETIAGTCPVSKRIALERMLFRATRGNVWVRFIELTHPVEDPVSGKPQDKAVMLLLFQGPRIRAKVTKILHALNCHIYSVPDTDAAKEALLGELDDTLMERNRVLFESRDALERHLGEVGQRLDKWKFLVLKERRVYNAMNMCDASHIRGSLIAEAWVPHKDVTRVHQTLQGYSAVSHLIHHHEYPERAGPPPTLIPTSKETSVFQTIVDSYGMADYREINPGVFTIVTFPFLFAVMFGDIGHGLMMAAIAAYFILKEKKLMANPMNEMVQFAFKGRYIIFLMGLFSIYTGMIYNETFSLPLPLWRSSTWSNVTADETTAVHSAVYPFGIDPVWAGSDVGLAYFNSLKMKMAIVFGVTHMSAGILLNLFNALYYRRTLDVYFRFIPEMLLMQSIFGYLCLLIFIKWGIDWNLDEPNRTPPSILQMLINVFLKFGNGDSEMQLYSGQKQFEGFLLFVFVASAVVLLVAKPAIIHYRHLRAQHLPLEEQPTGHYSFGELVTGQLIHTLEFVLGCISNTASYLRLWALSLAHSQLSIVFWDYFIILASQVASGLGLVVGFSIWMVVTVGVLLIMEGLSAFLHALRLHWVEFQNKFYGGNGVPFEPFTLY